MSIKKAILSTYKKVENFDRTYTPARWAPLVFALTLVFNAGDGLLTLLLLYLGAVEEVNPVIASLLHLGTLEYCLVKIVGGSLVLCWLYLRGVTRHRLAWYALLTACGFFGLLTVYYIGMLIFCGVVQTCYG